MSPERFHYAQHAMPADPQSIANYVASKLAE